jgi:hypothetical protein
MGFSLAPTIVSTAIRNHPTAHPAVPPKPLPRLQRLSVSGLRYYNPGLGRFLSKDPIAEIGSTSWIQREEAIRKLHRDLLARGLNRHMVGALMEILVKRHGANSYAFCRNNSVNAYDLLGELSCLVKAAQVVAKEAQIGSAEVAIAFTELGIAGAIADILAENMVIDAHEALLFIAEQALAQCLAFQVIDPCRDCSNEQFIVDGLENTIAAHQAIVEAYEANLDTLYETMASLVQQLAELSVELDVLLGTPCTWP